MCFIFRISTLLNITKGEDDNYFQRKAGLISLQKWPMCSRAGHKCQIWHTDSLGYSKFPSSIICRIMLFYQCSQMLLLNRQSMYDTGACLSMVAHNLNILAEVRELLLTPVWYGSLLLLHTSFSNEILVFSIDSNNVSLHSMTVTFM